jgi:hypothetical protein
MSAPCFDIFVLLNVEPGARAERDFPYAVRQRAFPVRQTHGIVFRLAKSAPPTFIPYMSDLSKSQ